MRRLGGVLVGVLLGGLAASCAGSAGSPVGNRDAAQADEPAGEAEAGAGADVSPPDGVRPQGDGRASPSDGPTPPADGSSGPVGQDRATAPPVCPFDHWCWENPVPQGNTLKSVHGTARNDVWAVGEAGTALHWDGQRWSAVPSGTEGYLRTVWAAAPGDVWAGGSRAVIQRWNGTSWSAIPSPFEPVDVLSISGSGVGDVSFAGTALIVTHFDGQKWGAGVETGALRWINALWADGPGRLWLVGSDGLAYLVSGARIAGGGQAGAELLAVHGTAEGEAWTVGEGGVVGRGDRQGRWKALASPTTASLHGVWAAGPGDVWAVGAG